MSRSPLTVRASIVTLTMNPALDVTADAEEVHHTSKIRCGDERYDAGGGGVNVARFVHALGGSVAAVFSAAWTAAALLVLAGVGRGDSGVVASRSAAMSRSSNAPVNRFTERVSIR